MTYRFLRLAAWCAAAVVAALLLHAWLASRDDQQRLRATLATQQHLLDAADARQRARQSALNETLAQIEKLKRTTQSPEQIVRELPKYLPLPQPITLARPAPSAAALVPSAAEGPSGQGSDASEKSPAASSLPQEPSAGARHLSRAESRGAVPVYPDGGRREDAWRRPSHPPSPSAAEESPRELLPSSPRDPSSSARKSRSPTDAPSGSQGFGPDPTTRAMRAPSLPQAVAEAGGPQRPDSGGTATSFDLPAAPAAQIPAADLKPLFDFVQDCRACQAQLAVAKQNAADDAAKLAALTRERDAALTSARGGTFWRRLRRNAQWFAVGAAVGAAAGYAAAR